MGLLFMLASAVGAGILFTLLVWIDSHTWIYIRKRFDSPALTPPSGWYLTNSAGFCCRPDYLQVDEQDPFLAGGPLHQPHNHPAAMSSLGRRSQGSYSSTGYFRPRHSRTHTPPPTPPYPGTLYVVMHDVLPAGCLPQLWRPRPFVFCFLICRRVTSQPGPIFRSLLESALFASSC
jgi:hypothetical protein